jgi:hypothetical protein
MVMVGELGTAVFDVVAACSCKNQQESAKAAGFAAMSPNNSSRHFPFTTLSRHARGISRQNIYVRQ